MSAHVAQDASGAFIVCDASGVVIDPFDPSDFGDQWITQRAITSACVAAGEKVNPRLVEFSKIRAFLLKDKRAARYSTTEFVKKMDPRRAGQILAGLNARYTVATKAEPKTAAA
jgi:hypothetical protein